MPIPWKRSWLTTLPLSALLLASLPAFAVAPVVQNAHTVGFEVEGMLSVTLKVTKPPGQLSEKAEFVQNPNLSYGLPIIIYEIDQIDRAPDPKNATAEIVTAPFRANEAGVTALLNAVNGAYSNAPAEARFTPSADFGGHEATVKISKGRAAGSVQTNLTVTAAKLFPDTDDAARTVWRKLTEEPYVAKVIPLVAGARQITNLLAQAATAPLHAQLAQRTNLRLWMYLWLARMSYEMGSNHFHVSGFYKDHHGCALKMAMDPVSSGLPVANGPLFANLHVTHAPLYGQIRTAAIAAVAASLGKTVQEVTTAWPADAFDRPSSLESVASERPLAARIVGGAISPIVEARRSNSPINTAARKAIEQVVLKRKNAQTNAQEFVGALGALY